VIQTLRARATDLVTRHPSAAASEVPTPAVYRRHQFPQVVIFALLVIFVLRPAVTSLSGVHELNLWLIYSLAALGFYWIFGLAGRFAFSHTFMMALGGFTSAYMCRHGASPWEGVLAAVASTAVVAAVVGAAISRAQEFYFAIATIAVTQVGTVVFVQAQKFTGPSGVASGVPALSFFGKQLLQDRQIFWLLLAILLAALVLAILIDRSPLRRRLVAARDNPRVAASAGIPVFGLQLLMFVLGSAVAGLSGALIGAWSGIITNDSFGIDLTVGILLMVVLGGLNSHWGAVVGAGFYVLVPEELSSLLKYQAIIYSGVLLLTIIVMPEGIVGALQRLGNFVLGRAAPPPGADATNALQRLVSSFTHQQKGGPDVGAP
jgi:branched-chain amino acid transport system permease protein